MPPNAMNSVFFSYFSDNKDLLAGRKSFELSVQSRSRNSLHFRALRGANSPFNSHIAIPDCGSLGMQGDNFLEPDFWPASIGCRERVSQLAPEPKRAA